MLKVGRNDLCPCGSGEKFKKCCGRTAAVSGYQHDHVDLDSLLQVARRHLQDGRLPQAEAIYGEMLRLQPNNADALHSLGLLAQQAGKTDVALEYLRRAVLANPRVPAFQNNLGSALSGHRQFDLAITHFQRALDIRPDYVEAHGNLGLALHAQGEHELAITHHRRALELRPDYVEGHINLGNAYRIGRKFDQALTHYRQALALRSNNVEALIGVGDVCLVLGSPEVACVQYEQALEFRPDSPWLHAKLLLTLNYVANAEPAVIHARHLRFSQQCAEPLSRGIQLHRNERAPGRRLKIGYVSSDFMQHPIAHFIEPILENHDHERFQIICYSNNGKDDEITRHIRLLANDWREITGKSDEAVAQMVREDGIDILVDLNGHTSGNRLLVFAKKPAPVQVTWLGYPNTTGLSTMDYRITDRYADPIGLTENIHSEELVRLPECFSCYRPPRACPDVAEPPSINTGYVVYGSFNNLAKITAPVMATWAEILRAVPDSRLTLKYSALDNHLAQQRVNGVFAEHGIDPGRLNLLGNSPSQIEHLQHYNDIDIGLDTCPYSGTTTTCDALWMGVPVVTLVGKTHAGRVGFSQMSNLGLAELIAHSPEEYVAAAIRLAADVEHLRTLRAGLRSRLAASPLMDAPRLTKHLERAYRRMWEKWCQSEAET